MLITQHYDRTKRESSSIRFIATEDATTFCLRRDLIMVNFKTLLGELKRANRASVDCLL